MKGLQIGVYRNRPLQPVLSHRPQLLASLRDEGASFLGVCRANSSGYHLFQATRKIVLPGPFSKLMRVALVPSTLASCCSYHLFQALWQESLETYSRHSSMYNWAAFIPGTPAVTSGWRLFQALRQLNLGGVYSRRSNMYIWVAFIPGTLTCTFGWRFFPAKSG